MKTTLNEILKHSPCGIKSKGDDGFSLLLKNLGKSKADDEPLDLMFILNSNGICDAVWALRCFDYKFYGKFLAAVVEGVLHIFEEKHANDLRARGCIQAIRDYCDDKITRKQLKAAYADADAYAYACAAGAAAGAYPDVNIKELFIKHFGEKNETN